MKIENYFLKNWFYLNKKKSEQNNKCNFAKNDFHKIPFYYRLMKARARAVIKSKREKQKLICARANIRDGNKTIFIRSSKSN